MTKKELMAGNEAVARGAYEAGVRVAAAYPGTPSTEILENFARYPNVYAEWAPNEKVAVDVAVGAGVAAGCIGGISSSSKIIANSLRSASGGGSAKVNTNWFTSSSLNRLWIGVR